MVLGGLFMAFNLFEVIKKLASWKFILKGKKRCLNWFTSILIVILFDLIVVKKLICRMET